MPVPQDMSLPGKSIYDLLFEMYPWISQEGQQFIKQQPMRVGYGAMPSGESYATYGGGGYHPASNTVYLDVPRGHPEQVNPRTMAHEMIHAWDASRFPMTGLSTILGPLTAGRDQAVQDLWKNYLGGFIGSGIKTPSSIWKYSEAMAQMPRVYGQDLPSKAPALGRTVLGNLVDWNWRPPEPPQYIPPPNGTWGATPSYPSVTQPSLQQNIQSNLSVLRAPTPAYQAPAYTPPASGTWSATAPQIPRAVSPSYNSNMSIFDLVSQTRR